MNSSLNTPEESAQTENIKPLLSTARLKAVNAGVNLNESPESEPLSLAPWFMASLSLPYRDPGTDLIAWERENGNMRIVVSPYVDRGKAYYPFGVIPRLLLTWMTTEALRTRSPEIEIADSLSAFMRQVGIGKGGAQKKRLLDQMQRLFNANVRIEEHEDVERKGELLVRKNTRNFQFAEAHELWLKEDNHGAVESIEWGSTVTLSPRFYDSIREHSFPIYTEALKALGNSPLRLDVYLFMVNRYFRLKRPVRISWEQLNAQFGGNFARVRDFKRDFLRQLEIVHSVYPQAKFEVFEKYIMLKPSPQHVPSMPNNIQALADFSGLMLGDNPGLLW